MDEIQKRLARLGWRVSEGVKKRHPISAAQKTELRNALTAQLQQTQTAVKAKTSAKTRSAKVQEKSQSHRQSRRH